MQLSWRKSLFLIGNVLRIFVNILTADDKHPLLNRDSLTQPSQMQLSQKQKIFSQFLAAFLKSRLNLDILLITNVFLKLRTPKTVVR